MYTIAEVADPRILRMVTSTILTIYFMAKDLKNDELRSQIFCNWYHFFSDTTTVGLQILDTDHATWDNVTSSQLLGLASPILSF